MQEPFSRAGGLHSYVRGLVAGQRELSLSPVVVDKTSRGGKFNIADGELRTPDEQTVAEYHFAHGAFPLLYSPSTPWRDSKKVFHFHGPWHLEGAVQGNSRLRVGMKKLLEWSVYSRFSNFVVASDFFGESLSRLFNVPAERIQTVYPGIDNQRFTYTPTASSHARVRLGIPLDAQVAVSVRRLEPRMGIEDAIAAIRDIPEIFLVIAGVGSLEQHLRARVLDLGLEARVKFLGRISDEELPLAYQAADFSLVPTRDLEGFGMVVLESMACGTPVIATNVGGLPEAMGPFASEWTVQPNSPAVLKERIRAITTAPSIRSAVRQYAMTRSNEEMAVAMERVIAGLQ